MEPPIDLQDDNDPNEPTIVWDDPGNPKGNIQHIARHRITQEDVEDVLLNLANETTESESTGRPLTFGYTRTGRFIGVVWVEVSKHPWEMRPVTAFDARPQSGRRQ